MESNSNKKFNRFWHVFTDVDLQICAFLFMWLAIVVFLGVFFRYVLGRPLAWTGELARYLFLYLSFVGISVAVRKKEHISISFILSPLPDTLRNLIINGGYLLTSIFSFFIAISGISFVIEIYSVPSAALRLPTGFVYLAGVIGIFLSAVYFAILAVNTLIKTLVKVWGKKQFFKEK